MGSRSVGQRCPGFGTEAAPCGRGEIRWGVGPYPRLQNAAYERGPAGRGKVKASASAAVRNPGC